MSWEGEGDGEQYAEEYQGEDDYLPGDGEAAQSWPTEPAYDEDPYAQGFDEGASVGTYGYDAGVARDLAQASHEIGLQHEEQQTLEMWEQDLEAARGFLGRDLSYGEYAALRDDSLDPGGHHDVANALNAYWQQHEGQDGKPATREQREARMLNSVVAGFEAHEPEWERVLDGPENSYALPPGATRQEIRDARTAWMVQKDKLNRGLLGTEDD